VSGGWTTTPPRADEGRSHPRAGRRWLLGAIGALVVVVVLLVWRPWAGTPVALPTPSPDATGTGASPSPTPDPTPDPSVTSSNLPVPTPPGTDTVFTAAAAQALFVTAEQIAGALPSSVGPIVTSPDPSPTWGLPPGGAVAPATCLVARTVVAQPPASYEARSWTGTAFTYRQEVTLLTGAVEAHRAFAELVGTVDQCATYTELDPTTGFGRWTTQPAIQGEGLYPSIVQTMTLIGKSATTNGYRGHLLIGNAIVTWTAWTPNDVGTLGPPDGLAGIVQDRALAAVRAAG
jgi:hypothetical protein